MLGILELLQYHCYSILTSNQDLEATFSNTTIPVSIRVCHHNMGISVDVRCSAVSELCLAIEYLKVDITK